MFAVCSLHIIIYAIVFSFNKKKSFNLKIKLNKHVFSKNHCLSTLFYTFIPMFYLMHTNKYVTICQYVITEYNIQFIMLLSRLVKKYARCNELYLPMSLFHKVHRFKFK